MEKNTSSPVFNYAPRHEEVLYRGVDTQFHAFLTSALEGSEWSASRHGRFTSGVKDAGTHWTGG